MPDTAEEGTCTVSLLKLLSAGDCRDPANPQWIKDWHHRLGMI